MLGAGAAVELEVLVDLRLALALGGLVDRELHAAVAVGDDLRHQRGVLGRDRLVGEVEHLRHAEDVLVELHPRLHRAQLDVADDVVDREQADVARRAVARRVAGAEALVSAAVDERVQRLAVGRDLGEADRAALVGLLPRLADARGAALRGLAVGVLDVRHRQGDHLHAVAVGGLVGADLVARRQRAREHEPDAALLEHVRGAVAHAGLEARVGDLLEAERVDVEERRLDRVAHVELDVVDAVQRHEVDGVIGLGRDDSFGAHGRVLPLEVRPFMIALSTRALKGDSLRRRWHHALHGRHRPADRCAPPPGCAALVPEHRAARLALRAGRQAARRPARGGGRGARLHGGRGPGPLRLVHARVRGALVRGADGRRGGPRGRRAPPRGRGRVHRRGRGERDAARARAGHRAPRGDARAHPRPSGRHAHADADRALDAVRAPVRGAARRVSARRNLGAPLWGQWDDGLQRRWRWRWRRPRCWCSRAAATAAHRAAAEREAQATPTPDGDAAGVDRAGRHLRAPARAARRRRGAGHARGRLARRRGDGALHRGAAARGGLPGERADVQGAALPRARPAARVRPAAQPDRDDGLLGLRPRVRADPRGRARLLARLLRGAAAR